MLVLKFLLGMVLAGISLTILAILGWLAFHLIRNDPGVDGSLPD